jgi:hypothetical protein
MEAITVSLIDAFIWERGYKSQFGGPLSSDHPGHFRTETRSFAAECIDRIAYGAISRDNYLHQKAAAIRCRRNILDEQTDHAVGGIAVC